MQRLLVGLVLVLTAAVGVLAVTTYNLHSEVHTSARRSVAAPPRVAIEEGVDPARIGTLEERMARVVSEIDRLQRESKRLARENTAAIARVRTPKEASGNPDDTDANRFATDRPRDGEGGFVITEQDEEFYVALQKRVERRRRIEGMTRNVARRVESLEKKGEIQALSHDARGKVNEILGRYVVAGDDLVTRYVRAPDETIKALTPEQRREEMAKAREEIVQQAQLDLDTVVGGDDAAKIGDKTLRAYGGFRRNERPSIRTRRGR